GCSFHGLALNIQMDLSPFQRINPCGYPGMEMVQISDFDRSVDLEAVAQLLIQNLVAQLDYEQVEFSTEAYNYE
ncbi:MAG: lipoyl(octanoyl) transferase LipB, partial [Vibrio sp.]